jgi:hypothetical protein
MQMRIHNSLFYLLLLLAPALFGYVESAATPLTQLTPILYNNTLVKAFLAEYLSLTDAQVVQADLVIAEARAKLFPLTEKLKEQQVKLDSNLIMANSQVLVQQSIASISSTQSKILAAECAALQRFHRLLDGDQRHKLSLVSEIAIVTNPQTGQPVLTYNLAQASVEQ